MMRMKRSSEKSWLKHRWMNTAYLSGLPQNPSPSAKNKTDGGDKNGFRHIEIKDILKYSRPYLDDIRNRLTVREELGLKQCSRHLKEAITSIRAKPCSNNKDICW